MAKSAKELREERMNLENKIRAMIDKADSENRDFNAEENAQYKSMCDESQSLLARAERLERSNANLQNMGEPNNNLLQGSTGGGGIGGGDKLSKEKAFELALQGWFNGQQGGAFTEEHVAAAQSVGINIYGSELRIPLMNTKEIRAFQARYGISSGSGAGTTIPESFVQNLELALLDYSPIQREAELLRTATGQPQVWPTANDTGNMGSQIGEAQTVSEVNPNFGGQVWYAFKITSGEILIPEELSEDNMVDLDSVTPNMLGERIGRFINLRSTVGTGAGTLTGIVPGATLGATAVAVNAITLDEVLDLKWSVTDPYRSNGKFMAHDNVFLKMRKLKNTAGDYLWQPSPQAGMPDRFDNSPVVPNNDMTGTLAASNEVMIFGDLKKYKMRQVNDVRIYKLMERHREKDCVAYVAFIRVDGKILDAGTHPIKKLVMAAS